VKLQTATLHCVFTASWHVFIPEKAHRGAKESTKTAKTRCKIARRNRTCKRTLNRRRARLRFRHLVETLKKDKNGAKIDCSGVCPTSWNEWQTSTTHSIIDKKSFFKPFFD
jgi:hypothetical protein